MVSRIFFPYTLSPLAYTVLAIAELLLLQTRTRLAKKCGKFSLRIIRTGKAAYTCSSLVWLSLVVVVVCFLIIFENLSDIGDERDF